MSRIGKLPIEIPSGVEVRIDNSEITVTGPKGTLSRPLLEGVSVEIDEKNVLVTKTSQDKKSQSYHGLMRTLVNNMVLGVTKGFETILDITGVGYRAEAKENTLVLSLGYSHPVNYVLPVGVSVEVEKMTKVFVRGADKELVGQTAAKIRSFRAPEPYKGKGIKYSDETILRKAGKTGKK
jgi:large subunit ribosomal protein L6